MSKLTRVVGIELSLDKENIVLHHPSCFDKNRGRRELCRLYDALGVAIVQAACSVLCYIENSSIGKEELSRRVVASKPYVAKSIYDRFSLGDLAVVENSTHHGEVALEVSFRLIAAIYRQHGFLRAFAFLRPFFKGAPVMSDGEYKVLAQEFAQLNHLVPEYSVISKKGPIHKPLFTCQLRIGSKTSLGVASAKKKAEIEAAKNFIAENNIELRPASDRRTPAFATSRPTTDRMLQLERVAKQLGCYSGCLTGRQLDICLTHISSETGDFGFVSNDVLHGIGARMFDVLCIDFLEDRYDLGEIDFLDKKSTFLKEDNFGNAVSDEVLEAMRFGSSVNSRMAINFLKVKADVAKSILAFIFINCCVKEDGAFGREGREFAYGLLEKVSEDLLPNYMSAVLEASKRHGFVYSEENKLASTAEDNRSIFEAVVAIEGPEWSIAKKAKGTSKRKARDRALSALVRKLIEYYPDDEAIAEVCGEMDPERQLLRRQYAGPALFRGDAKEGLAEKASFDERSLLRSLGPGAVPAVKEDAAEAIATVAKEGFASVASTSFRTYRKIRKQSDAKNVQKLSNSDSVSFDGLEHELRVCKGSISCRRKGHRIESVTGILASLRGVQIRLNVNYCHECGSYFMDYRDYYHYRDVYGAVLGNFRFVGSPSKLGSGYGELADESVLKLCGYTVGQAEGLTPKERRLILANMMDRGIADKARIIEYLQFFISNSKNRKNMQLACSKWREDLDWVRSYRIDKQRHFIIGSLRKG